MKSLTSPINFARRGIRPPVGRAQKGAALFTALMILIILTILALGAARVTALQERMAGVYYSDVRAFNEAENGLRQQERYILSGDEDAACNQPAQPGSGVPGVWGDDTLASGETQVENLNSARSPSARGLGVGSSRQVGGVVLGGPGCLFFRVSSVDFDTAAQGSRAIVQSYYIP